MHRLATSSLRNQLQLVAIVHATECNWSCLVLVVVAESVQNPKTSLGLVVPKMVMKTKPKQTLKHYSNSPNNIYIAIHGEVFDLILVLVMHM